MDAASAYALQVTAKSEPNDSTTATPTAVTTAAPSQAANTSSSGGGGTPGWVFAIIAIVAVAVFLLIAILAYTTWARHWRANAAAARDNAPLIGPDDDIERGKGRTLEMASQPAVATAGGAQQARAAGTVGASPSPLLLAAAAGGGMAAAAAPETRHVQTRNLEIANPPDATLAQDPEVGGGGRAIAEGSRDVFGNNYGRYYPNAAPATATAAGYQVISVQASNQREDNIDEDEGDTQEEDTTEEGSRSGGGSSSRNSRDRRTGSTGGGSGGEYGRIPRQDHLRPTRPRTYRRAAGVGGGMRTTRRPPLRGNMSHPPPRVQRTPSMEVMLSQEKREMSDPGNSDNWEVEM